LDELPQCINVLRGEMSLVGPRPEMPFIVEQYGPQERFRLAVRPGITGLWQISPQRYQPIHENLHYDRYYIAKRSLRLDFAIMLKTVMLMFTSFGGNGAASQNDAEGAGDDSLGSVNAAPVGEAQA
jgi:lipopolysaccharide/colanic/teichoic acid biosynthesis glycosyltransferase